MIKGADHNNRVSTEYFKILSASIPRKGLGSTKTIIAILDKKGDSVVARGWGETVLCAGLRGASTHFFIL